MIDGLPSLAGRVLGARHLSPQHKRPITKLAIMRRLYEMTPESKKIIDGAMGGKEALRMVGRFKPAHLAFPLSGRLMRNLGTIILVCILLVHNTWQDFLLCGAITPELICYDNAWRVT